MRVKYSAVVWFTAIVTHQTTVLYLNLIACLDSYQSEIKEVGFSQWFVVYAATFY